MTDQFTAPSERINDETISRLSRRRWNAWDRWTADARNLEETVDQRWFRGKRAEVKRLRDAVAASQTSALTAKANLFEALLNNFELDAAVALPLKREAESTHASLIAELEQLTPGGPDYDRKMVQVNASLAAWQTADRDYDNAMEEVTSIRAMLSGWSAEA